jgi:hypothetical protein
MTRGTAYIITNDRVLSTPEYNGDMYPDGKGDSLLTDLREVKHVADLEQLNRKWCKEYGYDTEDDLRLYEILPLLAMSLRWGDDKYTLDDKKKELNSNKAMLANWGKGKIDFEIDYYKYWFSDWLFIKNLTDKDITLLEMNGEERTAKEKKANKRKMMILHSGDTIRLNFGEVPDDYRKARMTLDEIKVWDKEKEKELIRT